MMQDQTPCSLKTPKILGDLPALLRNCEAGIPAELIDKLKSRIVGASFPEVINTIEFVGAGDSGCIAIDLYRLWVECHPGDSLAFAAWFNLGVAFAAAADRANAITAYRHTLALRPGFQPAVEALRWQLEYERLHLAYETNVNPVGRHIGSTLDAASGSANACVPRVTQQDVLEVVGMLRPWLTARTPKLRFGNPYDGGYVVPATALDCTDVLSIGIGGDVSFDLALADRGARVLQFDHTVDRAPRTHPNCTFHRLGWGPRSEAPFLSLAAMSGMLANPNARQALLKFDIEGAEYSILDAVETEQLALFTVIVCEIHDLGRLCEPAFFELVRSGLKKLTHRHTLVHLHANNSQNIVMVAGVPIPPVLEISLLRHDVDDFPGLSREPIPGPLDWPNYPFLPDICMNPF